MQTQRKAEDSDSRLAGKGIHMFLRRTLAKEGYEWVGKSR